MNGPLWLCLLVPLLQDPLLAPSVTEPPVTEPPAGEVQPAPPAGEPVVLPSSPSQDAAAPPSEEGVLPPASAAALDPAAPDPDPPAEAVPPGPVPAAPALQPSVNPHAAVKDEGELPPTDTRAELTGRGALGVLAALVPWVPLAGVCCTSAGLMALVYRVTQGDPRGDPAGCYGGFCGTGVVLGMGVWVAGLVVAPLAAAAGAVGMAGAVLLPGISQAWHRGPLRRATLWGVGGALASVPLMAAAVGLSGVLPWAVSVAWVFFSFLLPRNPTWLYARWALLNAAFMAAVVVGVGLFLAAPWVPVAGGLGAFVTHLPSEAAQE